MEQDHFGDFVFFFFFVNRMVYINIVDNIAWKVTESNDESNNRLRESLNKDVSELLRLQQKLF